ncbi:hypothetical protein JMA_22420 [Jeotgalibacillus malaysiensis]|uniref:Uncharacterized protein n=1 Tax=Jeotgalibacillus malaysiensis TaxID=1508404 RepID=A0A0B5AU65_9BACL|nr:hypothetical protein [Jeotgalibacillus malaysiensis]AJD91559.1 hypothetical protein JMA_22420 [Jeotgalibacillus malaysiensis]
MSMIEKLTMPIMAGYLSIAILMILIGVSGFIYVMYQIHKTNRIIAKRRAETEAHFRVVMGRADKKRGVKL